MQFLSSILESEILMRTVNIKMKPVFLILMRGRQLVPLSKGLIIIMKSSFMPFVDQFCFIPSLFCVALCCFGYNEFNLSGNWWFYILFNFSTELLNDEKFYLIRHRRFCLKEVRNDRVPVQYLSNLSTKQ